MERMWTLDGLRGLAAISVAIYHGLYWHSSLLYNSVGKYAVYLFFMLSAMTLVKVYERRFSETITSDSLVDFYRNRIARVLPLLALMSFLNFVFAMLNGGTLAIDGSKAFLTATGAFALGAPGNLSNAIGAWSLGIEFVFYLLFPVIALLSGSVSTCTLVVAAIALNLVQFVHATYIFESFAEQDYWNNYIIPLSFVGYFSWGVVLARLPRRPIKLAWTGIIGVLVVIWVSAFGLQSTSTLLAWPGALIAPILLAIGTYLVYAWDHPARLIPSFKFLGEISYSVYLVHPLIYFFLTRTFWPANSGNIIVFIPMFIFLSVFAAWLTHKWFEQPMRKWIRSPHQLRVSNSESIVSTQRPD